MNIFKRLTGAVLAAAVGFSLVPNDIHGQTAHAEGAVSLSYPVQEFRFGIGDTDRSIIISGTDSGDYLSSYTFLGERSQKWYLNYVSKGVYEIVNSQTGYVVTNDNGLAVIAPDTDSADQRWRIESVQKDFDGYDLYYKITSNADSSAALTFDPDSNSLSVDTYTGDMYQKYKLNLDGLEGFAGNCLVNGKEKAGTIGGLLGETVFVKSTSELVSALDSTDPKTVVITADIDLVNQNKTQQRIRDNKTIIGSYSKNTVYDSQLRNDDFYGKDDKPSGNIVIKNVNWVARTLNNTGSGVILLQFYGVRNLWLDHNNFSATFGQNRDVEVGKFVWINTPSTSWSDAKYNGYNPDYITASYNYFKNRYWTFAFGSQNKDTSRLHTTLMYNKWEQCSRRCPQYSNGYDHNYNNYHTVTGSSNPNKSSQVIGGEGSRIQNENCRFEGYTGNEVDPDRRSAISCYESGSYTAKSPSDTPTALKFTSLGSAWKPSDCYGYELVEAYNTSGTDIKSFCNAYSGCFKKYGDIKYITDSDCEQFVSKKYEQPFLKSVNVGNEPVAGGKIGAVFAEELDYAILNSGSGLSLSATESGSVQSSTEVKWSFISADKGYYIITEKKSGLALTVADGSNGTALTLSQKTGSDGQLFKIVDNGDGTYSLCTKLTRDRSCVGIAMGSTDEGAAAVQWESDGSDNQKWHIEARIEPLAGELITLNVKDIVNYKSWKLSSGLSAGSTVFGDRDVAYDTVPDELAGAEFVQTACDSKFTETDLAEVTANADITLYAALDSRVATAPAWLADWTKTELTVTNNNGVTFELYSLELAAGENAVLGANGQSSGCVNYTVIAVKSAEKTIKGNVNGDDEFSVADLVMMQRFLLGSGTLTDWQAGDLCEDGRIDVFDMIMMRRLLVDMS